MYFQTEKTDMFSHAIPRLRYLVSKAKKITKYQTPFALNIGVGDGFLENQLMKQGWKIYSLDPIETAIKRLRIKGIWGGVGVIEALPYKSNSFDVVFCSEVLEHLSDKQLKVGLKEVYRILKPDGYFLGTVPNHETLNDNIVVCPNCGQIFHRWGHQQQFDQGRLYNLIPDGLNVLTIKTKLFIQWKGINFKRKVAAFLKLILFYLGSHGSNETIFFLIKKTS